MQLKQTCGAQTVQFQEEHEKRVAFITVIQHSVKYGPPLCHHLLDKNIFVIIINVQMTLTDKGNQLTIE